VVLAGGFDVGEAHLAARFNAHTIDRRTAGRQLHRRRSCNEDGSPWSSDVRAVFERPAGVVGGMRHGASVARVVVLRHMSSATRLFICLDLQGRRLDSRAGELNGVMWSRAEATDGPMGPTSAGASSMARDGALVAHAMSAIMHQHFLFA